MDENRSSKITSVLKNINVLGKSIKKPSLLTPPKLADIPEIKNAIGVPVKGSGFLRILMYFIAGLLLVGIILLAVDQWVTPIFQRTPGGVGYIAIPGADSSQVFWQTPSEVKDIVIGAVPPPTSQYGLPVDITPSCTIIEGQHNYSITLDVLISNEYPQDLGEGQNQRVFFAFSQRVDSPSLRISLDNDRNRVYITCFDKDGLQQSIGLDNVPIHTPFRVGLTITPYVIEGYLNGMLVKTRQLDSPPIPPATGDIIFAPASISLNGKVLSRGISVLNVRTFGSVISPSEMRSRMGDLTTVDGFSGTSKSIFPYTVEIKRTGM
jgi:hypothetical protein